MLVTIQAIHTVHTKKTIQIKFCVIKWNGTGGELLNMLREMYLILCRKAFVGNDSYKTPPVGETSGMHCSGVILANSSTQTVF